MNDPRNLAGLLAVLVKQLGGRVEIGKDEVDAVDGMIVTAVYESALDKVIVTLEIDPARKVQASG